MNINGSVKENSLICISFKSKDTSKIFGSQIHASSGSKLLSTWKVMLSKSLLSKKLQCTTEFAKCRKWHIFCDIFECLDHHHKRSAYTLYFKFFHLASIGVTSFDQCCSDWCWVFVSIWLYEAFINMHMMLLLQYSSKNICRTINSFHFHGMDGLILYVGQNEQTGDISNHFLHSYTFWSWHVLQIQKDPITKHFIFTQDLAGQVVDDYMDWTTEWDYSHPMNDNQHCVFTISNGLCFW